MKTELLWISIILCFCIVKAKQQVYHAERGSTENRLCQASTLDPNTYQPLSKHAQLLQVHVFARHGDRTPLHVMTAPGVEEQVQWDCFNASLDLSVIVDEDGSDTLTQQQVFIPTSFYGSFTEPMWRGTCALGQLTPKGAQMQQALGGILRQVYVNKLGFLPSNFSNQAILVRSTDVW
jgi:hypothetical protein